MAQAIRVAPTDARGWRNRGMIRLYQGDSKGGVSDYDKALQYDPSDVFSWNNRGQAKLRLGDKQGAIADFEEGAGIETGPADRTGVVTEARGVVARSLLATTGLDFLRVLIVRML